MQVTAAVGLAVGVVVVAAVVGAPVGTAGHGVGGALKLR